MTSSTYQLSISFEQILLLVRQLPHAEKQQLSQELEKELMSSKLTDLLNTFKTDELSLDFIAEEVEAVRGELHASNPSL